MAINYGRLRSMILATGYGRVGGWLRLLQIATSTEHVGDAGTDEANGDSGKEEGKDFPNGDGARFCNYFDHNIREKENETNDY